MTDSAVPAISVQGLVKEYAGRRVVDGIDLEVQPGEVFALLGPNGAGKTTTVEIIEGYRNRDGGAVRVLGVDPGSGGSTLRAKVGLMLQGGGIDPRARPLEILRLFASFHEQPRDPIELIGLLALDEVATSPYRRLSGGERQRLGFALALVGRPELLVLDEPTAGMDPAARATTRELIRAQRDDGVCTLLTTHDLDDVERIADRVAIIDHGRIVGAGTPSELAVGTRARLNVWFRSPPSDDDVRLMASDLGGAFEVARMTTDAAHLTLTGTRPDPKLVSRIAYWAAARDLLITRLQTSGGSVEDRYLELTGDSSVGSRGAADRTDDR